jgi:phosphate transport system protein
MDRLHDELVATVRDPAWDHGVASAVDLILVGHYSKRFADYAAEVRRRTIST